MSPSRDPVPAAEAADRIWVTVLRAGETGLRAAEILEITRLTRGQFENGKKHLRDHRCAEEGLCFLYDGDVYVITKDPGRSAMSSSYKLGSMDRQLIRLKKSAVDPILEEGTRDAAFRYISRQIAAMTDNFTIMREAGFTTHSRRIREAAAAEPN